MFETTEAYKTAILRQNQQHIRGTLTLADGEMITLDDTTLSGSPRYEKRCTSDETSFAVGELYTGTAEVILLSDTLLTDRLRGAEMCLYFGVSGADDEIPLGVWHVTSPERRDTHSITLKCEDSIGLLDVQIPDRSVGAIDLATRMRMVTELSGVEFAQDPDDIALLAGVAKTAMLGTEFASTCRAEVVAIAQHTGCFVYADRRGKIVFRRPSVTPVLEIPASLRHSVKLSEYTFAVTGYGCTDTTGRSVILTWEKSGAAAASELIFGDNPYFSYTSDSDTELVRRYCPDDLPEPGTAAWRAFPDPDRTICYNLRSAAEGLQALPVWTPGEVRYYGDPAIDLGDMLVLSGGSAGGSAYFLVTADYWQFRAAQTLVSAGVPSSSTVSANGGSSGNISTSTTINVTGSEALVELEADEIESCGGYVQYLSGTFSCRIQTVVRVSVTAILTADSDNIAAEVHVLLDGVMQSVFASETLDSGDTRTVSLDVPLTASDGRHTASVEVSGGIGVVRISGCVTGMGIVPEQPDVTFLSDFTWRYEGGYAAVTGYTGTAENVSIPANSGGLPVRKIAADSFTHSTIKSVKIPEGAEEIE